MTPIDPNYFINDLQKRLANLIKRGRVNSLDFAKTPPLIRVEIENGLITDWIPFVSGGSSVSSVSEWQPVAIGEQVILLCESGDLNNAFVIASLSDENNPPPGNQPNLHVTKYQDGTIISYDTDAHLLSGVIAQSGSVELTCKTLTVTGAIHATGDISTDTNVNAVGNMSASGDVSDSTRSMADDRGKYNAHKHTAPSGGGTTTATDTPQ